MAWLRQLARIVLPSRGRHRGRPSHRMQREVTENHESWIDELFDRTPPAEARTAEPWQPRIARWVRLTFPVSDDTVLLSPVPAAAVLELMTRGFAWDPLTL